MPLPPAAAFLRPSLIRRKAHLRLEFPKALRPASSLLVPVRVAASCRAWLPACAWRSVTKTPMQFFCRTCEPDSRMRKTRPAPSFQKQSAARFWWAERLAYPARIACSESARSSVGGASRPLLRTTSCVRPQSCREPKRQPGARLLQHAVLVGPWPWEVWEHAGHQSICKYGRAHEDACGYAANTLGCRACRRRRGFSSSFCDKCFSYSSTDGKASFEGETCFCG